MKQALTPDQIADLAGIQGICDEIQADLVVIGAMSLVILLGDIRRFTRDLDLTVALDLNDFDLLTSRLARIGWTPAPRHEHRWTAPRQTIVDLLPAGPMLRRQGAITWPVSQFTMSLVAFDHVFTHGVAVQLSDGLSVRVAPPAITALLKIVAYVEDPYRRAKDLQDIRVILARYEADSDRQFSDEVFDALLPDFEFTNAFY